MLIVHLLRGLARFLLLFVGSLRVSGRENVPPEGPYLLVINHMSMADPPLVMLALPAVKIRFFAGEKWERHALISPLLRAGGAVFIRRGELDRQALRNALHELEKGSIFGLSPEGTRSRVGALIRAREGAAYLATRSRVPLLPVGVVNTDQISRNLVHLRRTRLEARIGRPFTLPGLDRRPKGDVLSAYTHYIMIHIAAELPPRYWGHYADSPALKALLLGEDPWPYCLAAERDPA
jgi:1-acyl-sn-glycerol-3-phosphate acyltransferase